MATQKQTDANRQNALRSTGPRTEHGKSRSRANAFIHGLACMTIYKPIRHEDAAQYHEMRAELVNAWQPWDAKEFQLVELAASAYKRIQRSEAYESALFTGSMEGRQQKRKKPIKVTKNDDLGCGIMIGDEQIQLSWDNLDRYRRNAWTDYNRAITQLSKMQKERKSEPAE
ncbi:MAG: hypothetical protein H7039_24035, partial [Bryobacteraceae bacterium]|nr:hypothetical protein [Bryobacteraceae bacterium]